MSQRRVVVTGLGMVTPLGLTVDESWQGIVAGRSGITEIDIFDASQLKVRIYGGVKNFDPSLALSSKDIRKTDIFIHYACEAARQAVADADLTVSEPERAGAAIGAGIGGLEWIHKSAADLDAKGPRRVSPFFIPGAIINMAAGLVSMQHNLQGPSISIVTACTTGTHNIGHAARMIQHGDADVMLAGGTEMASCALGIAGFSALRALSQRNDDPEAASRPWDQDRDGFVLGDGAGVLVLESLEHAQARGAKIYCEYGGFGMSSDAYHMTAPQPERKGFKLSMNNALTDAGLSRDAIDYVNAHGTSTPAADHLEAKAVEEVFGEHAGHLSVSSTKSMIGHLLGAAGAVEAIFSVLAIRDQVAPPTINLHNPIEDCALDLVPHKARPREIRAALSNSFGFGGTNGTLIFKQHVSE